MCRSLNVNSEPAALKESVGLKFLSVIVTGQRAVGILPLVNVGKLCRINTWRHCNSYRRLF